VVSRECRVRVRAGERAGEGQRAPELLRERGLRFHDEPLLRPLGHVRDHEPGEPELDEAWRFIQALPVAQRTVVVLRFYEDLGLTEIAALLGRPPSTVRSDLRRALRKLKGSLV
jgi:RNA polymerase sigma factor (sigma-70 family)